ncbi:osmotically-inducible protein OsmY [Streptomyces sp. SAI-135]|uniref:hypothetical protein n=1 Tax=unclassified Streptomyces TaxID=2593676 RepID=UPI002474B417|nr:MULTISPECIES: hypothetical protein [unclassified Streptomyces]MDH6520084.1 osmotically-inducible protein OsmY [Streptomyces sp. SAI-090]MDH6552299.1 osmotically-inducible protein OsmY [Streptomyces sp. SAI-041]MDH6571385.1 osmotically-inducible protein OsmY [Streptomyces sp. SAI-117]MDH6583650.1 osmotically-inducible protein OsmY [Streptomyces sp. SAI-133]MDH6615825.1 osmotically-inducible protein OsmY [Streptomyces sp. SAI-135]
MSRRVSLPGADELFRTTGGMALQASTPRRGANGEARVPAPAGESDGAAAEDAPQSVPAQGGDGDGAEHVAADAESAEAGESRLRAAAAERSARRQEAQEGSAQASGAQPRGKRGRSPARRPSGRERHDEKITVYVSAEELMDLEHARLVLRGEHGLAVDRGRIVREAVAVVLADLESRGDASILVRRLRGR